MFSPLGGVKITNQSQSGCVSKDFSCKPTFMLFTFVHITIYISYPIPLGYFIVNQVPGIPHQQVTIVVYKIPHMIRGVDQFIVFRIDVNFVAVNLFYGFPQQPA